MSQKSDKKKNFTRAQESAPAPAPQAAPEAPAPKQDDHEKPDFTDADQTNNREFEEKSDQETGNNDKKDPESPETDPPKEGERSGESSEVSKKDEQDADSAQDPQKDDEKDPEIESEDLDAETVKRLQVLIKASESDDYGVDSVNDKGETLFYLVKDGWQSDPMTLEALEVAVGVLVEAAEQNDLSGEDYDALVQAWLQRRIEFLMPSFGADDFDLIDTNGETLIKLLGTDPEKGGPVDLAVGTLEELEALDDAQRRANLLQRIDPETMKRRRKPMSRRKILRVLKPFNLRAIMGNNLPANVEDRDYQPGEVFDWALMDIKPFFLARIYCRGVVGHISQDDRVEYPVRPVVREPAPVRPEEVEAPIVIEQDDKNPASQQELNERRQIAEKARAEGRKFTRKNEALYK